jgi:hypothetical protein
MKLQEALELLQAGVCVARAAWAQSEGYLTLLPGMNHVWKIITHPGPNCGNHIFSVPELLAEDWIKLSEKEYDEAGNPKLPEVKVDAPEANVEL